MLVKAAKAINMPVILAGHVADKNYLDYILAMQHDVAVLGTITEAAKWKLLRGCAIHALPSFFENPGLVHAEASLAGTISVMGNRGCEPEFYGSDGVYCDPTSIESIANALMKGLAKQPSQWANIPDWRTVAWRAYQWMKDTGW
jgi:glycosyltransferase involved in cell wall biosynthesis